MKKWEKEEAKCRICRDKQAYDLNHGIFQPLKRLMGLIDLVIIEIDKSQYENLKQYQALLLAENKELEKRVLRFFMRERKFLVIHCTATPAGRKVTSDEIRDWHTAPRPRGRGWRQVGYRDMIHLNGQVENLVPYDDDNYIEPWEITNGVKGYNGIASHVVYVGGGKGLDTRTEAQRNSLALYVFREIKQNPNIKIAGHNQFATKDCPSFNVPKWLESLGVNEKNIYRPAHERAL